MWVSNKRAAIAVAAVGLLVTSLAPVAAQDAQWPDGGPLDDGSAFELSPRIRAKLDAGEAINYVFSYQSPTIPIFSDQYQAGYETTLPLAQKILPTLSGSIIAPESDEGIDVLGQIAQIQALLDTESIDCLSIEPPDLDAFTAITNEAMAMGIPVFTVGVTTDGNELTNFTQVPSLEGAQAADILLEWMAETGNELDTFAVSAGDPTAFWAQGRMKSFRQAIQAALPDATFINSEENALVTTYRETDAYDAYMSLINGNPDLDFIETVDIGAAQAARAIVDSGRDGEMWTLGWNVSYGQLDAIDAGQQVALLDLKWSEQGGFGALACADFLANGIVRPNTQELLPVTAANSAEVRAQLDEVLGGPS